MGRKVLKEEYLERMKKQHPDIEVLGDYINFATKVDLKCKKDGYLWSATPNKSLNCNHGCPKCGGSLPLTHEEFVFQMKKINSNIEIESNYVNDNTKVRCHCLVCNNYWENTPSHLKTGEKCPICSKIECGQNLAMSLEEFKDKLSKINDGVKILSKKYTNGKTKVKCECLNCKHKWYATPTNLLKNRGCPKCKQISKTEKRIMKWFDENNINYISQYKIEECKDNRPLRFDFYLTDYNLLLEYDGEQHFFPVCFGGISLERAEYQFTKTKERDKIKNNFCKEHNLRLVRISYLELKNLENKLKEIIDLYTYREAST